MRAEVKKRPAYLIGLIENRARAAAEEQRIRMVLKDLGRQLAHAKRRVQAYDLALKDYNPALDGSKIKAVAAHRTGPRGNLRKAIEETLAAASDTWLTTAEITGEVQRRLGLHFHTGEARRRWAHNSLAKQLKRLVTEGLVDRTTDPAATGSTWVGARWRLISDDGPSRDRLIEQALAAGGSVRVPDAGRE